MSAIWGILNQSKGGRMLLFRARISQEWAQGLVCTRVHILNRPKNLNTFDELKYIMWTYTSVLVGMYQSRIFIPTWGKYFTCSFYHLHKKNTFVLLLFHAKISKILSRVPGPRPNRPMASITDNYLIYLKGRSNHTDSTFLPLHVM